MIELSVELSVISFIFDAEVLKDTPVFIAYKLPCNLIDHTFKLFIKISTMVLYIHNCTYYAYLSSFSYNNKKVFR